MDVRFAPLWLNYLKVLWQSYRLLPKGSSLRHLLNVNPAFGPKDLFVFSKISLADLLREIDVPQPEYLCVEYDGKLQDFERVKKMLDTHGWLLAKPEFGARSKGISVLKNTSQLTEFLASDRRERYIVQAFVSGVELSILFSRLPADDIKAQSIVQRSKLAVLGDGEKTIKQLAAPLCDADVLTAVLKLHDQDEIVPIGEKRLLSILGTYRFGATYDPVLEQPPWVSEMESKLSGVSGLNYCRLDIVYDPESQDYWVLELNGSHAEPLEAYEDPDDSSRFYDILSQSILQRVAIGKAVEEQGVCPPNWLEALSLAAGWCFHQFKKKTL